MKEWRVISFKYILKFMSSLLIPKHSEYCLMFLSMCVTRVNIHVKDLVTESHSLSTSQRRYSNLYSGRRTYIFHDKNTRQVRSASKTCSPCTLTFTGVNTVNLPPQGTDCHCARQMLLSCKLLMYLREEIQYV